MNGPRKSALYLLMFLLPACGQQLVGFPAPTVTSTSPARGAVGVGTNARVAATFSVAMNPSTINDTTFTLATGSTAVAGAVTYAGSIATFAPAAALAPDTTYSATITTGAKSADGEALATNVTWSFSTGVGVGGPPAVISTSPANGTAGIALNQQLSVLFSTAMNPATIDATTFTLTDGTNAVPGTVSSAGATAGFAPTLPLKANTTYTATITTGAQDTANLGLAASYNWSFSTGVLAPPAVTLTNPGNGATGVALNQPITVTFNGAMDPTTINSTTFTVTQGTTPVAGAVTYAGTTATFTSTNAFLPMTTYTATITTGAQNAAHTAIPANYSWNFTTAPSASPVVLATNPGSNATGVALNQLVTAMFNEQMDPSTITTATFTLMQGTIPVPGAVTYAGTTATFAPTNHLSSATTYGATITTGAQNTSHTGLGANYSWSFTTMESGAPFVTATNPLSGAMNVPESQQVTATFSTAMKQSTISTMTFTLAVGMTPVTGLVSYSGTTATFAPSSQLNSSTTYTATITTGAQDLAGVSLAANDSWSFTTGSQQALAVNLGTASGFGIASRAGLTSTGVTVVNGDVALYPLASCTDATGNAGASQTCLVKTYTSTTGLTVNGSIYWAGDPFDNGGTASSVTNDLNIAWTQARNMADTEGAIAGDQIGGQTFGPGVYHNATLALAAGTVATLDAKNDSNAVFFFKVDSSFVDSGTLLLPSTIALKNGAAARNVWFVTGLDITIGSGTTWNGNILAGRTATVNNGAKVLGRVLAGASGAGALTLTGAASPSITTVTVPQ